MTTFIKNLTIRSILRCFIISLLFLNLTLTKLNAEVLQGQMQCKVKTNRITIIEDGIGKEFQSFSGGFKVGDTLVFEYSYDDNTLAVKIRDGKRSKTIYEYLIDRNGGNAEISTNSERSGFGVNSTEGPWRNWFNSDNIISEGSSLLNSGDGFIIQEGKVTLERYYKNDWEGIIVYEANFDQLHVFTLDCRHIKDQLDNLMSRLEEQYNEI